MPEPAAWRPARPAPAAPSAWARLRPWLQRELFGSPASALATLGLLALAAWALPVVLDWALWNAVWHADAAACQAARGQGACWGVVVEKHRLILFGRYPMEQLWRPTLASAGLLALVLASGLRRCWARPRGLLLAWALGLPGLLLLMGGWSGGQAWGLGPVPTERWGGLPLTLLLSVLSTLLAFPLAVALALGRRSTLPVLRVLCAGVVEVVRGVPLISVLFMASFLFPLLLPGNAAPDVLLRVWLGIALFAAAYLAETVRAGLQALPTTQAEAAASLGLGRWATQRHVLLPQALTQVLPALLNSAISLFKDSSLVTIVSLYELTGALGLALNGDPLWRPFLLEGYAFITALYFVACLAMSRYSLWLERQLARRQGR